jgi:hypothetical protein
MELPHGWVLVDGIGKRVLRPLVAPDEALSSFDYERQAAAIPTPRKAKAGARSSRRFKTTLPKASLSMLGA